MSWAMSKAQQGMYWRLWGAACRAQHWDRLPASERDARRKEAHVAAFGREKSATAINRTEEFGRIKAHFLMLAGDLAGTVESDHPEIDHARRWRNKIGTLKSLLAALGIEPESYVQTILRDVFHVDHLEDLPAKAEPGRRSALERLLFTLTARVDAKRQEFAWSVHKLYSTAGRTCPVSCVQCRNNDAAEPF